VVVGFLGQWLGCILRGDVIVLREILDGCIVSRLA
jgi:hypothetical protein